jgi:hypothetical protein
MIGGLLPWHPEAGGGQVIAYKLTEALFKVGMKIRISRYYHFIVITTLIGNMAYIKLPLMLM